MKKITFLILLFLLSVTAFLYSQPADIINKTQFVNGNEGILGPQCISNGMVQTIHQDYIFISWNVKDLVM